MHKKFGAERWNLLKEIFKERDIDIKEVIDDEEWKDVILETVEEDGLSYLERGRLIDKLLQNGDEELILMLEKNLEKSDLPIKNLVDTKLDLYKKSRLCTEVLTKLRKIYEN